jgi:hypothetical protein
MDVDIQLLEPVGGRIEWVGQPEKHIDVQQLAEGKFFIYLNEEQLAGSRTEVKMGVYVNGELESTAESNFNGPRK